MGEGEGRDLPLGTGLALPSPARDLLASSEEQWAWAEREWAELVS